MIEVWKDIPDYEGLYQISDLGRVKSLKRNIILKPFFTANGYYQVTLFKNGKNHSKQIHRLVGENFIKKAGNKNEINHIDGNKQNNCITNLEWCTSSYNKTEAYRLGLMKRRFGKENPNSKVVYQYDLNGNFIKKWDCAMDIQRELGIPSPRICSCCLGISKTAYKYKWKYVKEN